FIALFFSFLCSLLEASLLSITPSYIGVLNQQKSPIAKDLQSFKNNIDKPLAAILTLNTFAHTIGAAGVGAQAQIIWGEAYLTLVSIILTIIVLIFTEIIPKTLGANYWRGLSPFTVKTLKILIFLLYPIIYVSQLITKRLKRNKEESVLSRADFTAMAEIGTKEGILLSNESRVIQNVLRFEQILASDIMTPRTVMLAAPEVQTIQEFYHNQVLPYSRIPLYVSSIDHISGYVLKDEVMHHIIKGEGEKMLSEIKRPIKAFVEDVSIPKVFAKLMEEKEHITLIVDEYGGTAGILTIEDIIETLLGLEITDEFDDIEDLRKWAKEKGQKRARDLGYIKDINNDL
ncbi:MAG: CNNM domain-containing protein, partial [Cyclobacteriaceae bacterium]